MRFQGSKRRIAPILAAALNANRRGRKIIEPFCGGLNATVAFGGQIEASDANAALIALYQCIRRYGVDWLPEGVSEAEWRAAKLLPDDDPLKGFIGHGCSWGGIWFGSYARNDARHDYAAQSKRSLAKTFAKLDDVRFTARSFFDIPITPGALLYCDPPYMGVTGYGIDFDHARFQTRVFEWAAAGSDVFVSEYSFPADWVWEGSVAKFGGKRSVGGSDRERLYYVPAR